MSGQVMKHSDGTERIVCNINGVPVDIKKVVVECTDHATRTEKSLHELKQIAWTLELKGKQIVGFAPPQKKRYEE